MAVSSWCCYTASDYHGATGLPHMGGAVDKQKELAEDTQVGGHVDARAGAGARGSMAINSQGCCGVEGPAKAGLPTRADLPIRMKRVC